MQQFANFEASIASQATVTLLPSPTNGANVLGHSEFETEPGVLTRWPDSQIEAELLRAAMSKVAVDGVNQLVEVCVELKTFDDALFTPMRELIAGSEELSGRINTAGWSTRLANVLQSNCLDWSELVRTPIDDLVMWKHFGRRSHLELVARCLGAVLSPSVVNAVPTFADDGAASCRVSAHEDLQAAIARIFEWDALTGRGIASALEALAAEQGGFADAAQLVRDAGVAAAVTLSERFASLLEKLDDRSLVLLNRRILADDPATLEELGQELGVTRERVRQVEAKVKDLVDGLLARPELAAVHLAASVVTTKAGRLLPESRLAEILDSLSEGVAVHRLLRYLAGGYDRRDARLPGWVAKDAAAFADLSALAKSLEGDDWDAAVATLSEAGCDDADRYLTDLGFSCFDGCLLWIRASANDAAAAALGIRGSSMTVEELYDAVGTSITDQSFRNALSADPRMHRVRRRVWELVEWGGVEYENIVSVLRDAIVAGGGAVDRARLITSTSEEYEVADTSVRQYLTLPWFSYDRNTGLISLASEPAESRASTPPLRNKLSVVDGRAVLRVTVDGELLRGSGRPVPVSLARRINLPWSEDRRYPLPNGDRVTLTYPGQQPTVGSLRKVALDLGCEHSDFLLLAFSETDARASRVQRSEVAGRPFNEGVAIMIGLDAQRSGYRELSKALECDVSSDEELEALLLSRRDHEVVRVVRSK